MFKKILISFLLFVFSFSSSFADDVILNQIQNSDLSIFSSENLGENDNQISGTGTEENGTGKIEDGNEKTEENNELIDFQENFIIKNKFKNPTYLLDKDEEKDEYFCDKKKKDCKVNFDFSISFNENYKSRDFSCEIIYLDKKIDKCNLKEEIFEKETEFKIKIFKKKNKNIFKERVIKVLKEEENSENEQEIESGTGTENSGTGETEEPELSSSGQESGTGEKEDDFLKNFEIKNNFQNPTYLLEKEEEKDEYFCESNNNCKVNFDFRKSFNVEFKEKDYICEISYLAEKEESCNPNTITFQEKETEVNIKIISKKNKNIFKERKIKISKKEENSENEQEIESGTGTENFGTGETEEPESSSSGQENGTGETEDDFLKYFEIKNNFQNPTYLLEKEEEKDEYFCESNNNCKVNFDFRKSFDKNFKQKDFICELYFGGKIIEGCNPSTFEVPIGEFEVFVKIFFEKDKKYFKQKKYIIKNIKNDSGNSSEYILDKVKIKVQSGLLNRKCEKKNCNVNFIFETKDKNLSCLWDFGNGIFKSGAEKKCNPSSVYFPYGNHLVTLKVYKKGYENNFLEDYFEFENTFNSDLIEPEIILDGKSKEFQVFKKLAICNGFSSCDINFGVRNSPKDTKKYFWDFGNGENFDGKNPKSIKFFNGKYKISLKIYNDNNNFKEIFFYLIVDKEKKFNDYESILKYRKSQNNLYLFGKNREDIFINKSFDFPFIGDFIYNKDFLINVGENGDFNYNLEYDKPGIFDFGVYEILDSGEKKFLENKKIEIDYKGYFLSKIIEIEKQEKELLKELKKEKKSLEIKEKFEEKKFLKIILQGKTTKNKFLDGKTITCIGICNLNFGLETNIKDSKNIIWNFGKGEKFEGKNPKSRKYNIGNYKVEALYEDINGNILKDYFEIKVFKKKKKSRKPKKRKLKIGKVNLVIEVQGRIGKNKILEKDKVICKKSCSLNFDGRKSSGAYKELIWDFGNGEKFIGENPKSVKYKEFGNYEVILSSYDFKGKIHKKIFKVEFTEEEKKKIIKDNINFKEKTNFQNNDLEEKKLKKDDIFFILFIITSLLIGSFILLRKYKIF